MINSVAIMGRLTADPELKTTNNGNSVASFCIAVDRPRRKNSKDSEADFINVTAWRQTAEFICNYFSKGSMIAIEGSLRTNKYTDKNGNNRTSTFVLANNVSFCGSKSDSQSNNRSSSKGNYIDIGRQEPPIDDWKDDGENDLPF